MVSHYYIALRLKQTLSFFIAEALKNCQLRYQDINSGEYNHCIVGAVESKVHAINASDATVAAEGFIVIIIGLRRPFRSSSAICTLLTSFSRFTQTAAPSINRDNNRSNFSFSFHGGGPLPSSNAHH